MLPVAILAGGLRRSRNPVTQTIPKALVEINGEPFLAHQLRLLRANGISRVVLCIGHLGEMIQDFLGDGSRFGIHAKYSFDGPVLLGTAGALKNALPLLGDAFFVLYGDSYLPCRFADVQKAFETGGKPALMTVFRNQGQWDASNVAFDNGRIIAYDKRNRTPAMRHIDYGLGVLSRTALEPIAYPCDLAALYQDLLKRGDLASFEVTERFYEAGSFAGVQELAAFLRQHKGEGA
ncbi:MAG: NTP transferase domain-containing protein [Acidobacteria bacterium]|nr:NTP transferase domain-containing protein [Acidobacteriota bacterium]